MKTETLLLAALGIYLFYAYNKRKDTAPVLPMQIPPTATPPYVPPPRQILTAAQLQLLNQAANNTVTASQNAATAAGGGVSGIGYVCDTSNKLTAWGTNNNYNAVILKY